MVSALAILILPSKLIIERNNDGPTADATFVDVGLLCARKLREGNLIVAANPTAGALK